MALNKDENEDIFISQNDFLHALTRVFPSVSRKDELVYARLEHSLRRTRGHIEGNDQNNADAADKNGTSKPPTTPKRSGANGLANPPWKASIK